MATAQSQFTIVDFNDAITLTGYINSNLSKTQMYNPDNGTYNPDWTENNLVLTPSLFLRGGSDDLIQSSAVQSVSWYKDDGDTALTSGSTYDINATTHALTVKSNVMANETGVSYRCVVTYYDDSTKLSIPCVMDIAFSRVVNGSGITALDVTTPNGNIFKNGSITSLTAKAELWRGSVVDTDKVSYQWYKLDPSVSTNQGGGVGWAKLTDAANKYSGSTTNVLTIYGTEVNSYATYKCVATDTDSTSATHNQTFENVASFVDMNDPINVVIESTGGSFFKNGEGETRLTARVYQNGVEIDTAGEANYTWSKYDAESNLVSGWTRNGKGIDIGAGDVDVKSTYVVTVVV